MLRGGNTDEYNKNRVNLALSLSLFYRPIICFLDNYYFLFKIVVFVSIPFSCFQMTVNGQAIRMLMIKIGGWWMNLMPYNEVSNYNL